MEYLLVVVNGRLTVGYVGCKELGYSMDVSWRSPRGNRAEKRGRAGSWNGQ